MTTETEIKLKIVDADGHYLEPAFELPDYIEPKYRDAAPRIVKRDDGFEYWEGRDWAEETGIFGGTQTRRALAIAGLAGVERWNVVKDDPDKALNYTQMNPASLDPIARLKVLDEERMDAAVLYPTFNLNFRTDAEFQMALNRALNDWLADRYISADPRRLYGVTNIVTLHDVDAACREVDRCAKQHGFKATYLRPGLPTAEARWWKRDFDRFWATCQDLDVAVAFHPFSVDRMYGANRDLDLLGPAAEQQFLRAVLTHPVDALNAVCGIIVGGVLERFPRLRVAILESGGGWLVPMLERLDHRFEHMGWRLEDLSMQPSDYFRRQGWISFDPDEATLGVAAEWLGADRIIWGSDFPHPDAFYPNFVDTLNDQIAALPQEDQDRIRGLNAMDFYKLPNN